MWHTLTDDFIYAAVQNTEQKHQITATFVKN